MSRNKSAIITGGSRGIGRAISLELAKSGYDIAITYNNSAEKAEEVTAEAENLGVRALSFKADVKEHGSAVNIAEKVSDEFGKIDVLINNAAISLSGLFTDCTPKQWSEVITTNLTGCYNYCHTVLPYMLKEHSGSIINISSMWGQVGASCEVAYSASKAGIIGLTKALAKEVSLSGIRVNAIAPGVIRTDMLSEYSEQELDALREETPLNRLGNTQDIADCAVFLAGDNSSFITGQIIGVNGGFVI